MRKDGCKVQKHTAIHRVRGDEKCLGRFYPWALRGIVGGSAARQHRHRRRDARLGDYMWARERAIASRRQCATIGEPVRTAKAGARRCRRPFSRRAARRSLGHSVTGAPRFFINESAVTLRSAVTKCVVIYCVLHRRRMLIRNINFSNFSNKTFTNFVRPHQFPQKKY